MLLSLVDGSGGSVRPLLMKAGVDVNKLRAGLLSSLDALPKVEGTPGELPPEQRHQLGRCDGKATDGEGNDHQQHEQTRGEGEAGHLAAPTPPFGRHGPARCQGRDRSGVPTRSSS